MPKETTDTKQKQRLSLKQRLRQWLDVPTVPEQRDYTAEFEAELAKAVDHLDRSFTQRINRFRVVHCINCAKDLIDGRDPVYTNFKGQKFCSHECIDIFGAKTNTPQVAIAPVTKKSNHGKKSQ